MSTGAVAFAEVRVAITGGHNYCFKVANLNYDYKSSAIW
jgi:hypothetical protein